MVINGEYSSDTVCGAALFTVCLLQQVAAQRSSVGLIEPDCVVPVYSHAVPALVLITGFGLAIHTQLTGQLNPVLHHIP